MKGRFAEEFFRYCAGLRQLFFTKSCPVCKQSLTGGKGPLCRQCMDDIPLTYFWDYSENAAMERFGTTCHLHNAAALFFYRHESPYCEIVRQFKYGRRLDLGLWAARLLGGYLASSGLYGGIQAVVPVPLHPLKRWRRGFNQAEIIARGVAERLGHGGNGGCAEAETNLSIPLEPHLLSRRRYTSTQTRRGAASRQRNVSGAFAINRRELERLRAAGVRHILLTDDVCTTGATLSECIRLLQDHFTVSVATLGFVE